MVKDKETPKMETVKEGIRLSSLLQVEVCNPIKEQIDAIEVCTPQIVTTCIPVQACIPSYGCLPTRICRPDLFCRPDIFECLPTRFCRPEIWCRPLIYQECAPSQIDIGPIPEFERLVADVKAIKDEIAQLKQKIK
jgi:hypothetical protein